MVDFESINFIPSNSLQICRSKAEECLADPHSGDSNFKIPEIEKAEALEALGVSEYFEGDYQSSVQHLVASLKYKFSFDKRRPRRLCNTMIMVSLLLCAFFCRVSSTMLCCIG
jgi:hypothetical protein